MNLTKLFEIQRELDGRIVEEKGLQGQDLLPQKILALQVELGELANEWRRFKFWSKDREPRTRKEVQASSHMLHTETINPLLEEYVDCLHFILSVGLDLNMQEEEVSIDSDYTKETTTETFSDLFEVISDLRKDINCSPRADLIETYEIAFNLFVGLAEKFLNFTWEQIEQAYLDKNKVNHERQDNGY